VHKPEYSKLDEGLGGAYEHIAIANVIERAAKRSGSRKVLELNSTFIAGLPGFNSAPLAQRGFDVTITVHSRDYDDAVEAWRLAGLKDKVTIIRWDDDLHTGFKDGEFDIVWNHLAFEHYKDPMPLVREMKRVTKEMVINMTLSPWNIGFPIHWLIHKIGRKKWDHGYFYNTLISTMAKAHREAGLTFIEAGGCDDPPWMDTVDLNMGESMRYFDVFPEFINRNWRWNSTDISSQSHWIVRMLWSWESLMPEWFRRYTAHHLYVISGKENI
jgi:SAM-dependent methyltransferase